MIRKVQKKKNKEKEDKWGFWTGLMSMFEGIVSFFR
jgi:hypothetical protein